MRSRSNSYGRKRVKVHDDDFEIPQISQYNEFLDYDYNVKQLKIILKSFKLKLSGNKNELSTRIFHYMKENHYSVTIQKTFRMYLRHKFYRVFSNCERKQQKMNNDSDFYTMEEIEQIHPLYVYTYQDDDHFTYQFKITSLIKYLDKGNDENPYNRKKFTSKLISEIAFIRRMYKIYEDLCEKTVEQEEILTRRQKIVLQLTDLFQIIDDLGNISDINWILNLNKRQLVILMRELHDIWGYRAQLDDETKRNICPPNGTPFHDIHMNMINRFQDTNYLLETCIHMFSNMLKTTADDSNKSLAALYILSALTIVSQEAADSLPWLFQSVAL